jgi:hypothetical protein
MSKLNQFVEIRDSLRYWNNSFIVRKSVQYILEQKGEEEAIKFLCNIHGMSLDEAQNYVATWNGSKQCKK